MPRSCHGQPSGEECARRAQQALAPLCRAGGANHPRSYSRRGSTRARPPRVCRAHAVSFVREAQDARCCALGSGTSGARALSATLVVDASIAVEYLLRTRLGEAASAHIDGATLAAPEL